MRIFEVYGRTKPYKVHLDGLILETPYSGILSGEPDEELNKRCLASHREDVCSIYGKDRPFFVESYPDPKQFPARHLATAWLCSYDMLPRENDAVCYPRVKPSFKFDPDGSHLFVTFFVEDVLDIEKHLQEIFLKQPWDTVAKDFWL